MRLFNILIVVVLVGISLAQTPPARYGKSSSDTFKEGWKAFEASSDFDKTVLKTVKLIKASNEGQKVYAFDCPKGKSWVLEITLIAKKDAAAGPPLFMATRNDGAVPFFGPTPGVTAFSVRVLDYKERRRTTKALRFDLSKATKVKSIG